jgi:fused-like protein
MINQRYILKQQLGQGRSKVYSVIDTEFPEKEIAMKILPADVTREEKDSFRQEYFTIKKLDHPNIIKAYDLGTILTIDDEDSEIKLNSLFITLEQFNAYELLDYPSLRNEEELVTIIKQTCSVLYYLHQSNYIYYDLKPQNILVSRDNNRIIIKIIDLGFARNILSDFDHSIRGTAEYLAPELLKKEPHDHTVDLYSLGIILYQIVYEKYPFNLKTELEIYKAHIDGNFDYPVSTYSEKIISIIKKLLNKDPNERYTNTLEVLFDLGIDVNQEITKDFLPAKVLSGRKDTLNILRTYFNDKSSNEIFSIRGFSGAGKSQVLFEIHSIYPQSVYIENTRRKTGIELIRFFLYSLLYSDGIFQYTSSDDKDNINQFFTSGEFEVSDSFKSLLSRITENKHILLLVDDYNLYDDFARETINEILPILQINKIKVVIAESSEYNYATEKLYNIQTINLTPFTERQLSEYLELSYYPNFPKNKLKKVILDYADLLPGSIVQFIKDILILGVMHYLSNEVTFVYKDNIEKSLRGSNEEIYRLRLSNLSNDELKVTQLISAFSISVEQIVLASVLNKSQKEIEEILLNLQYKNIINPLSISNSPNITSDSFKRYIYNTIKEKKKYHFIIASLIKRILPEFNIIEHARHYKLAGEIIKVVELINIEIKRAENLSAYGYKKKLIEDLLQLQINNDIKTSLLIELVNTLYKLSDFNKAIDQASKIEIESVDMKVRNDLKFIIGSSLISLRRIPEGIEILNELLKSDIESSFQHKVLVEIAYAEFELNNYKDSEKIALDLLKYNDLYDEEKGKCYNLLGMIKIYANEDINSAIGNFNNALKMYQKAQLPRRVAGVEVNLGNIYNMIGDDENSEKHWGNALKINESIGNLEQEAAILINYGVYFLYKYKIDKSIQYLTRSDKIFSAIGNKVNQGLVSIN